MSDVSINPPLSPWVRAFTVGALIVLLAGPLLLFAPQVIVPRWPWAIAPFNARFLGAIYTAEFVSLAVLLFDNRWSPGRAIFVVALIFTALVSLASVVHLSAFAGIRRTALWFILYVGYAALTLGALLLYRRLPGPETLAVDVRSRRILEIAGTLMLIYGAGLFIAPTTAVGFWPWPIDAMHGRIYSAAFLAPGLGTLILARSAARAECLVGGLFIGGLGLFAIIGFVLAHLQTGRASFASIGTWLWLLLFTALLVLGARMIIAARE